MVAKRRHPLLSLAVVLCVISGIGAFQPSLRIHSKHDILCMLKHSTEEIYLTSATVNESSSLSSRRNALRAMLQGAVLISASALVGIPGQSFAAAVPSPAELKKLQLGHSRVQYLLSNWDSLTETCNNKAMSNTEQKQVVRTEGGGGGFCDKTPLIVQEYLGYKSTEDPLFKADKLMLKAVPLVDESVMDAADYVDIVEQFREKADQTSLMAYTSSWGEANPNGGKEVVDEYLERTKDEVKETERLLRKILGALKLEVLDPSNKRA